MNPAAHKLADEMEAWTQSLEGDQRRYALALAALLVSNAKEEKATRIGPIELNEMMDSLGHAMNVPPLAAATILLRVSRFMQAVILTMLAAEKGGDSQ